MMAKEKNSQGLYSSEMGPPIGIPMNRPIHIPCVHEWVAYYFAYGVCLAQCDGDGLLDPLRLNKMPGLPPSTMVRSPYYESLVSTLYCLQLGVCWM